jgi:hypothetical protein
MLSKLNADGLFFDSDLNDIYDNDGDLICGVEVNETVKGTIYIKLYFDKVPYKYFESDIVDADINSDMKLSLLNLIEEQREYQEHRNAPDPDDVYDEYRLNN